MISTPTATTPHRQDLLYSAGLGLTYKLSQSVQIEGQFRKTWQRSSVSGNNYAASTFLLGIRLQR